MTRPILGRFLERFVDNLPKGPKCHYCNDTGMVACRARDSQYAFAGPVPDDAKGYFDADCWYCDSGRPLEELSQREALR